MITFINENKAAYGVEPICREIQIAPSTYYAARSRPPSARAIADEELKRQVLEVYRQNYEVYGVEKVWIALQRKQVAAGRDHVARLMGDLGIEGVTRGNKPRTTKPAPPAERPADLVKREPSAPGPNRLWVADLTYVATWAGFAYTAFVIDAYSRRIVGWRVSASLRADLALDALEMAIWTRRGNNLDDLVHHSDRGVQYLSVRYTQRLADEGAVSSVGSKGDSYDNALAEAVNSLYKFELIYRRGPWRSVTDVELATLAWVDWWNNRRVHSATGGLPPAEFEAARTMAVAEALQ
jgi:putative transposase